MLVVKDELAYRLRELATLPPALESTRGLGLAGRSSSSCGLDRIGGRTEVVGGDVRHGASLTGRVRGVPCCRHDMAARRANCEAPGIELHWAGTANTVRARRGEPSVRISGSPGELLLYLFGRQDAAHVEVRGPAATVEAVQRARFGM